MSPFVREMASAAVTATSCGTDTVSAAPSEATAAIRYVPAPKNVALVVKPCAGSNRTASGPETTFQDTRKPSGPLSASVAVAVNAVAASADAVADPDTETAGGVLADGTAMRVTVTSFVAVRPKPSAIVRRNV